MFSYLKISTATVKASKYDPMTRAKPICLEDVTLNPMPPWRAI